MNIHKVNMKYICIFKNSTVHLYNNERCLKKIKKARGKQIRDGGQEREILNSGR